MSVGWPSSSLSQSSSAFNSTPFNAPISSATSRVQKRRYENEDDSSRDEPMDLPQRVVLKRPRLQNSESKPDKFGNKDQKSLPPDGNEVDVGLLLASLPSQSLLPILNSLLNTRPELKLAILPLIPRPVLPAALKAILQSAEELRNSYPYSTQPSYSSSSFGFGSKPSMFAASSSSSSSPMGFGSQVSSPSGFNTSTGMSDSYIASRIRSHVDAFVAVCLSYLPYFSFASPSLSTPSNSTAHAAALQAFHKDECHPGEVFTLLAAITNHFLAQPAITQSLLAPVLLPRLAQEWSGWVSKLDQMVNAEARMFGSEAVNTWANELDDMVNRAQGEVARTLRESRDRWIERVGWLIGRGQVRWG